MINIAKAVLPPTAQRIARKVYRKLKEISFRPFVTEIQILDETYNFYIGEKVGVDWYVNGDWTNHRQMKFLMSLVSEGDIILQCGSHHGFFALPFARKILDTGKVICVEAHPRNYRILQENVKINKLTNTKTLNMAVGDKKGTTEILDVSNASISSGGTSALPKFKVEMDTLDNIAQKFGIRPTFVMLDIEGFETPVMKHAVEIMKFRPKLAIEIHTTEALRYGIDTNDILKYIPQDYDLFIQYDDRNGEVIHVDRESVKFEGRVQFYAIPK